MKPSFILALIFGAFFWFLYQDQNNRLQKENTTRKLGSSCFWILGIATLIKIILAPHFKGYEVDMNTYSAWMQRAAQGLNGFYADGYFCDYPPLYIMMTGFFGWICKLFGGGDYLTKLFVKMPGIIAEGLIAYEVLKLYNRHYPKAKQSTFAVMLALWPSFLVTGTYWGQTDSIFCYLMLLTIRFVMEDKLTLSALLFTLSALTKPQSFLFAPLFAILFAKSDSLVSQSERQLSKGCEDYLESCDYLLVLLGDYEHFHDSVSRRCAGFTVPHSKVHRNLFFLPLCVFKHL